MQMNTGYAIHGLCAVHGADRDGIDHADRRRQCRNSSIRSSKARSIRRASRRRRPPTTLAPTLTNAYLANPNGLVSTPAWGTGGGSVSVSAGGSIIGVDVTTTSDGVTTSETWADWLIHYGASDGDSTPFSDCVGTASLPDRGLGQLCDLLPEFRCARRRQYHFARRRRHHRHLRLASADDDRRRRRHRQ